MPEDEDKPRSECRRCGEVEPEDEMDEVHICRTCHAQVMRMTLEAVDQETRETT